MNITRGQLRTTTTATLALSLALALSACGTGGGGDLAGVDASTEDATEDDTDDATEDDDASTDAPTDTATPAGGGAAQSTAAALAAIATAQDEVGGTAYALDDSDDDGTWEVDVRVADRSVEVTVTGDGSQVERTEDDDLDEEDAAALDAATVTLSEAIEAALASTEGMLDDAALEDEDGQVRFEVSVRGADDQEVELWVDPLTAEVVGSGR